MGFDPKMLPNNPSSRLTIWWRKTNQFVGVEKLLCCFDNRLCDIESGGGGGGSAKEIGFAASDESSDLQTGNGIISIRAPYAFELTGVRAYVGTAPVGTEISVDILKGEVPVSVLTTPITIDPDEPSSVTADVPAVIAPGTTFADDEKISVDLNQVGDTSPGKGLKIWLYVNKV